MYVCMYVCVWKVQCSAKSESTKKGGGGGREGEGERWEYPTLLPSPLCFSYSHLFEPSLQSEDQEHAKVALIYGAILCSTTYHYLSSYE